jgi:hypothetical protein
MNLECIIFDSSSKVPICTIFVGWAILDIPHFLFFWPFFIHVTSNGEAKHNLDTCVMLWLWISAKAYVSMQNIHSFNNNIKPMW